MYLPTPVLDVLQYFSSGSKDPEFSPRILQSLYGFISDVIVCVWVGCVCVCVVLEPYSSGPSVIKKGRIHFYKSRYPS